ncbi:MAG: DUF6194 family protein [Gammaproteobacteria bacterium]
MELNKLIAILQSRYTGLIMVNAWGETSLFYNPLNILKRGTYCITFKQRDGENDASSQLDRDSVKFRMNFKLSKSTFLTHFNEPSLPDRPGKGDIISLKSGRNYDPSVLDQVIPHPVYAWMSWVSVINPSKETIETILELGMIDEAYRDAVERHDKNKSVIKHRTQNTASDESEHAKRGSFFDDSILPRKRARSSSVDTRTLDECKLDSSPK